MLKYKNTAPLFLYFEGQMHLYRCVNTYFLCYNCDETILQNIRLF